ncbi:hypothetical protein DFH09DRAFT_1446420 [Mycena vulgaris]|nr:hypothetical protein DFH09DRAFT_1446420 [Mycena vulgaris]
MFWQSLEKEKVQASGIYGMRWREKYYAVVRWQCQPVKPVQLTRSLLGFVAHVGFLESQKPVETSPWASALCVPTSEDLEAFMEGTDLSVGSQITRVLLALRGISFLYMEGLLDPTIQFLHVYWECLDHTLHRRFSKYTTYSLFLMVVLALDTDAQTSQAIDATPGVRMIVAHAWVLVLDTHNDQRERRLRDVGRFLQLILKPSLLANFEEIVDGVGGSLFDLAVIVVKHIRHVVPAADSPTSVATIHNLSGIFKLLIAAPHHPPDTRLRSYLVDNGIVTTLVTLIRALAAGTTPLAPKIMFSAFSMLDPMITGPGHMGILAIIEALKAGLLLAVLASSKKNDHNLDLQLQYVLRSTLPNSMVYVDVVTQIAESMGMHFATKLTGSRPSEMFIADWAAFNSFAHKRITFLRSYQAGAFPSYKACDNLERPVRDLPDEAPFSTMFGLPQPLLLLNKLPNRRLADGWTSSGKPALPEFLGTQDRAFMRALLHMQYLIDKAPITFHQIKFMIEFPGQTFYIRYDYTDCDGSPPYSFVGCLSPETPGDNAMQTHWAEHLSRAVNSGGRMELQVMRVAEGGSTRQRIFPLRWASSAFHGGAMELVREFSGREKTQ